MRVAFLGGGTGGHLSPGIAVAETLRASGHESLFLVAGRRVEHDLLGARALPLEALFPERGDLGRPSPLDVGAWWRATSRWRHAVLRYDPGVIVVLGGWVALPALLTGFLGRPSVLLEQNARAGRVQRLLGGRVGHACLAVEGADMPRGRRGTHVTGNPQVELPRLERAPAARRLGLDPDRRTLLLMGGSQGSRDLNALRDALAGVLAADGRPWQILHLTGQERPLSVGAPGVPVVERRFCAEMAAAYSVSDIAVCRAGASTVSELAATGTPSILVPYPHHKDRHQEANGRLLVDAGGALLVPASDPTGRRTVPGLLAEALGRLDGLRRGASRAARPEAARRVAEVVLAAAGEAGA